MFWIVIVLSYLLGSIPTAYIASRWLQGRDIRHLGDANVGAANAFRELGSGVGIAVGIIDCAKGALAVLMAERLALPQFGILMAGTAAVLGHNFPLFLGFRGGRGVNTTIGIFLVVITQPMLILTAPTLITLLITKNVTKAMVVLFVPLSVLGWWLHLPGLLIGFSIFLPCMVALTHLLRTRHIRAGLNT